MIKVEHVQVFGFGGAIRGMRNPMNSWEKSDTVENADNVVVGDNDLDLMRRLCASGPEHRKYLRMIHVQMDITGPLYWWKEYDTYKVATVANSCSTMHKLASKPFELSDFSIDGTGNPEFDMMFMKILLDCEKLREAYVSTQNKIYWVALVQLLPESYNQKRTVDLNYETVLTIIGQRKDHKLQEWHDLVKAFRALPLISELEEVKQ